MSEAIELSVGGNNKGFVAVLNDTEQKAKQSGEKIKKSLDAAGDFRGEKLRQNLNSLAGDFARVTSVSQAFDTALSKIGGGLKAAGAAVAVSEMTNRLIDATMRVKELREELDRLSRPSGGQNNASLVTTDAIMARLGDLNAFGQKNVPKNYGDIMTSFWGGLGDSASRAAMSVSNPLNPISSIGEIWQNFSVDEGVNGSVTRANQVEGLIKSEKNKLFKKYLESLNIAFMRTGGDEEGAARAELQMRQNEQLAAADGGGRELRKKLEETQEAERRALDWRFDRAASARLANERVAENRTAAMKGSLDQPAVEAQRKMNKLREDEAITAAEKIRRETQDRPSDLDAASALKVADEAVKQIQAENSKWERDLERNLSDQKLVMQAEEKALSLRLQGREKEAQLVERRARAEIEALRAGREQGSTLENNIRKLNAAKDAADRFNEALTPEGKLRSEGSRMADVRQARIGARNRGRAQSRYDRNNGLLRVFRGTDGSIISGIDPISGKRVGPNGEELAEDPLNVRGGAIDSLLDPMRNRFGGKDKEGNRIFDAADQARWSGLFKKTQFGKSNATREMEHRAQMVGMAAESVSNQVASQKKEQQRDTESSGTKTPTQALNGIHGILKKWDSQ